MQLMMTLNYGHNILKLFDNLPSAIISYKHGVYELSQVLLKDLRLDETTSQPLSEKVRDTAWSLTFFSIFLVAN